MYKYLFTFYFILCFSFSESFFLFKEKLALKPFFFCFKVCPLYCSPRRNDPDESSLVYSDDDYYIDDETFKKRMNRTNNWEPHPEPVPEKHEPPREWWPSPEEIHKETDKDHFHTPNHFDTLINVYYQPHYYHTGKINPPTTTPAPTTTEEPSGICMFCEKKCHFPLHHR